MTNVKPWEQLEVNIDRSDPRYGWWYSNHTKQYESDAIDPQQIEAMILMADTNGYNQYYRYFFWYKGSDERMCVITNDWILKEDLGNLIDKQLVEMKGVKFIVDDKFKQDYIKILKRVDDSNKLIFVVTIIFILVTIGCIFSRILFNWSETQ